MSFNADELTITLVKTSNNESRTFNYPFKATEIAQWIGSHEVEVADHNMPFDLTYPFETKHLNEVISELSNSTLSTLSDNVIRNIVDNVYEGSWKRIFNPDQLTIIEAPDDRNFAMELQEQMGWDANTFVMSNQDILNYIDWDKVGRDLRLSGDYMELDGYYVQSN
ncbi:antirestriction protein ArdA [Weissella ceti]|uniref:Antirestriction protein ArdA n=1 Tax=Weissella ceti TaxID=759620 RepID=A0ABT3E4E8_9LACO|nr:antirestriction protein ArdA [Weissella ceti]MCW0953109.1 antirestriction protein ArdA [Weissella ceti]QVK12627.1 antirestriction protein ArdA [Weissella ceti]